MNIIITFIFLFTLNTYGLSGSSNFKMPDSPLAKAIQRTNDEISQTEKELETISKDRKEFKEKKLNHLKRIKKRQIASMIIAEEKKGNLQIEPAKLEHLFRYSYQLPLTNNSGDNLHKIINGKPYLTEAGIKYLENRKDNPAEADNDPSDYKTVSSKFIEDELNITKEIKAIEKTSISKAPKINTIEFNEEKIATRTKDQNNNAGSLNFTGASNNTNPWLYSLNKRKNPRDTPTFAPNDILFPNSYNYRTANFYPNSIQFDELNVFNKPSSQISLGEYDSDSNGVTDSSGGSDEYDDPIIVSNNKGNVEATDEKELIKELFNESSEEKTDRNVASINKNNIGETSDSSDENTSVSSEENTSINIIKNPEDCSKPKPSGWIKINPTWAVKENVDDEQVICFEESVPRRCFEKEDYKTASLQAMSQFANKMNEEIKDKLKASIENLLDQSQKNKNNDYEAQIAYLIKQLDSENSLPKIEMHKPIGSSQLKVSFKGFPKNCLNEIEADNIQGGGDINIYSAFFKSKSKKFQKIINTDDTFDPSSLIGNCLKDYTENIEKFNVNKKARGNIFNKFTDLFKDKEGTKESRSNRLNNAIMKDLNLEKSSKDFDFNDYDSLDNLIHIPAFDDPKQKEACFGGGESYDASLILDKDDEISNIVNCLDPRSLITGDFTDVFEDIYIKLGEDNEIIDSKVPNNKSKGIKISDIDPRECSAEDIPTKDLQEFRKKLQLNSLSNQIENIGNLSTEDFANKINSQANKILSKLSASHATYHSETNGNKGKSKARYIKIVNYVKNKYSKSNLQKLENSAMYVKDSSIQKNLLDAIGTLRGITKITDINNSNNLDNIKSDKKELESKLNKCKAIDQIINCELSVEKTDFHLSQLKKLRDLNDIKKDEDVEINEEEVFKPISSVEFSEDDDKGLNQRIKFLEKRRDKLLKEKDYRDECKNSVPKVTQDDQTIGEFYDYYKEKNKLEEFADAKTADTSSSISSIDFLNTELDNMYQILSNTMEQNRLASQQIANITLQNYRNESSLYTPFGEGLTNLSLGGAIQNEYISDSFSQTGYNNYGFNGNQPFSPFN